MELYNEDCFEAFKKVKDRSVNLFLLDLPYGQTACKWDSVIDLEQMWKEIKRTMVKDGIIVFFCTTKFGFTLIQSNPKWFKYDLVWKKSRKVGFLSANKMPLRQHEMIYVFKDKGGTYNPQKTEGKPYNKTATGNNNKDGTTYGVINRSDYYEGEEHRCINKGDRHPTSIIEKEAEHEMMYVFKEKQGTYNPQKTEGHKPYNKKENIHYENGGNLYNNGKRLVNTEIQNKGDRHPTSIVEKDLGEIKGGYYRGENGKPFKRMPNDPNSSHPTSIVENTILEYKNPPKTLHRTQKPVDLCEWLIKSYSNEGDMVMDFCMGSGTTGVACKNTNRNFIGVEKDEEIFKIAKNRIE